MACYQAFYHKIPQVFCHFNSSRPVFVACSHEQDIMGGRDYRTAATWAVSFSVNATEGKPAIFVWLRSTWPDRPAQALLQVMPEAEASELDSCARSPLVCAGTEESTAAFCGA